MSICVYASSGQNGARAYRTLTDGALPSPYGYAADVVAIEHGQCNCFCISAEYRSRLNAMLFVTGSLEQAFAGA
jgi:hypothetical protein